MCNKLLSYSINNQPFSLFSFYLIQYNTVVLKIMGYSDLVLNTAFQNIMFPSLFLIFNYLVRSVFPTAVTLKTVVEIYLLW